MVSSCQGLVGIKSIRLPSDNQWTRSTQLHARDRQGTSCGRDMPLLSRNSPVVLCGSTGVKLPLAYRQMYQKSAHASAAMVLAKVTEHKILKRGKKKRVAK